MNLTFDDIYDEKVAEQFEGKQYVVDLNNNKIKIEARDPYGHWYITFSKGALPAEYTGAYTSLQMALAAVNKYLSEKNKDVYKEGKKVA